jgi:iron donor protein CyaY
MMDRTTYQRLAFQTVHAVQEAVEAQQEAWDVELHGEILTLVREDGKQFVLNLHNVTQQLWYSSPLSGAWHFAWDGAFWKNTRGGRESLTEVLQRETGITL